MEAWVLTFDNWEVCDQCCMNLFEKSRIAFKKCIEWGSRAEEFVKRAGFVLMARFAVSAKSLPDDAFVPYFAIIKREATDARNYVKKGVNWALRQIGKRSVFLNKKAIQIAMEIAQIDSSAAHWIAKDALKELSQKELLTRLQLKSAKKSS